MEDGVSGVYMVNVAGPVVEGRKLEGVYAITLHPEMEDYHVVVVQCKLLTVMLRRAVSCVKHLNHIRYSKCNNYTRSFMNQSNNFIVE